MSEKDIRDQALPSAQDILALAEREELIALELVARATTMSSKRVFRDWQKRKLPFTRIGRTVLLPTRLMIKTYFPARDFPSTEDHN